MKIKRYLVVGKQPNKAPNARLTVSSPSLDSHEVAVLINLDIPDELFTKPQLQASITVPVDSVTAPTIDAEVIDNIQETVSKAIGVDLSISVISNDAKGGECE